MSNSLTSSLSCVSDPSGSRDLAKRLGQSEGVIPTYTHPMLRSTCCRGCSSPGREAALWSDSLQQSEQSEQLEQRTLAVSVQKVHEIEAISNISISYHIVYDIFILCHGISEHIPCVKKSCRLVSCTWAPPGMMVVPHRPYIGFMSWMVCMMPGSC